MHPLSSGPLGAHGNYDPLPVANVPDYGVYLTMIALAAPGSVYAADTTLQSYAPAFTLHHEYVGHWSLTPDFAAREYNALLGASTVGDVSEREERLRDADVYEVVLPPANFLR